jgi:glycine/D-amino acid oxidase-like deaminating enzyme
MTMRVCILGGGVVGASIAYYLSLRGVSCVIVEKTSIASAASGKSGGFLARVEFPSFSPL